MDKRKASERHIFFPWEGSGGLRRTLGLGRMRPFIWGGLLVAFVLFVGYRERERAGVRQTRATIGTTRDAVERYMAEHEGACPSDLAELARVSGLGSVPLDAWGRPLRLICPSRRMGAPYDLMSDGPDRKPGGLDRIQ